MGPIRVILLPGAVLPTQLAYRALLEALGPAGTLPPGQFMQGFMQLQVRPDVVLPPPAPDAPPPWLARRPAGIAAFLRSFRSYDLDRGRLAAFNAPVLFVLGALSNPDQFGEIAQRLSAVFPDLGFEVFAGRHHFDPPHRVEPGRLAQLLRAHRDRAEGGDSGGMN